MTTTPRPHPNWFIEHLLCVLAMTAERLARHGESDAALVRFGMALAVGERLGPYPPPEAESPAAEARLPTADSDPARRLH